MADTKLAGTSSSSLIETTGPSSAAFIRGEHCDLNAHLQKIGIAGSAQCEFIHRADFETYLSVLSHPQGNASLVEEKEGGPLHLLQLYNF